MIRLLSIYMKCLHVGILFSGCILFPGCQEVIDVDLNAANPAIVIEGSISDQAEPYSVKLSKTISFDQPNIFPGISGALVIIRDNVGNADTLTEVASSGTYTGNALSPGVPGRNYILKVVTGGEEYQALSTMHPPIPIDTIIADSTTFGPESSKYVKVKFMDPAGVNNFYRVIEIINGSTLSIINVMSDEFQDGDQLTMSIFSDEDPELKSGDTVELILQSIDENVYNYFLELMIGMGGRGFPTAPANPTSNITNNALGYFNAYSVTSKTIVVP